MEKKIIPILRLKKLPNWAYDSLVNNKVVLGKTELENVVADSFFTGKFPIWASAQVVGTYPIGNQGRLR